MFEFLKRKSSFDKLDISVLEEDSFEEKFEKIRK